MSAPLLHPDRLFSANEIERDIARRLYERVRDLPIISPHGHTDPAWFAGNAPFQDAASLLVQPDHYLLRMLYSQGIPLEALGIAPSNGEASAPVADGRRAWRCFAEHYHLFRGTPSRLWFDHALTQVFGIEERLSAANADDLYDRINEDLSRPEFRPRALFDRFQIEVLATTESPLDPLSHHDALRSSDWDGRIITAYRPDPVVDPEHEGFAAIVARFGELTGEDTSTWGGYLTAHRARRAYFKARGATSSDHGHAQATTADLTRGECERLFEGALLGRLSHEEADLFRGQMLTEMAAMSLDDGLVLQIHPGVRRNHNTWLYDRFGRDKGADIPTPTNYVDAFAPLLQRFGNEPSLSIILFTLDETSYSRELAPLAGHYPCLKLGPPWWFLDSPEAMMRYKRTIVETAGFHNTVGFNDDTRAFLSIPARHDVARRMDCRHLAELVADHRLGEGEAHELAYGLAYQFAKDAYRL